MSKLKEAIKVAGFRFIGACPIVLGLGSSTAIPTFCDNRDTLFIIPLVHHRILKERSHVTYSNIISPRKAITYQLKESKILLLEGLNFLFYVKEEEL